MIRKSTSAFTIVELIIATVVAGLLSMIVVGFYVAHLRSYATSEVRNTATTDMQQALSILTDDVRNARRVMTYNMTPDIHAPSMLQFAGSKGPAVDTDPEYYWRSTSGQLVLERTPRDASGTALYDAPIEERLGKSDYVVYYVYQNDLYRRYVPTNAYASNRELPLSTCTVDATRAPFGGCSTDQKVLSKLKTQGGSNGFDIRYLSRNGSEISVKNPDNSPNYEHVSGASGVSISVYLAREGGGQTLDLSDRSTMMFRPLGTVSSTPPVVVSPDLPTVTYPSIAAGPGGLTVNYLSEIRGPGAINVIGRVTASNTGIIGSAANPISLNIGNKGCGSTAATYPTMCSNNQAMSVDYFSAIRGGVICATGQTSGSFSGTVVGLQRPCTADPLMDLPFFNKAVFTSAGHLTGGIKTGTEGNCNSTSGIRELTERTRYIGQVNLDGSCQAVLMGDVYITGGLLINYLTTLKVSDTLDCRRPTIVVNGKIEIANSTSIVPNSCGVTPRFISFLSSDSACSSSDMCTSLSTAANRFSSRNVVGVQCNWYCNASTSSFYAYFSKVEVTNGSSSGALAGQGVVIDGSATVQLNALGTGW